MWLVGLILGSSENQRPWAPTRGRANLPHWLEAGAGVAPMVTAFQWETWVRWRLQNPHELHFPGTVHPVFWRRGIMIFGKIPAICAPSAFIQGFHVKICPGQHFLDGPATTSFVALLILSAAASLQAWAITLVLARLFLTEISWNFWFWSYFIDYIKMMGSIPRLPGFKSWFCHF